MTRHHPVDVCAGCGRRKRIHTLSRRWCSACVYRWSKAGKPAGGPPSPPDPAEGAARAQAAWMEQAADKYHEFAHLRSGGDDWRHLTTRLGISHGTAHRYNYVWLRRELGLPLEKAAARMNLKHSTALNYERTLKAVPA